MKLNYMSFIGILVFSVCLTSCTRNNTQIDEDESINLCHNTTLTQDDNRGKTQVARTTISTTGSTRATAYVGNKIITKDGKTFIGWLDHIGELSQIKVKCYDIKSKTWGDAVNVGTGADSHGGPSMTMDNKGYLHMVYGAHHQPLKYSRTVRPMDISEWVDLGTFGSKETYPSLITAPDGTLWCATRSSATDPWRLCVYCKLPDQEWSSAIDVLEADELGYAQTGNTLVVGADGTIHLGLYIYTTKSNAGKVIGYLRSHDNAKTWENAYGDVMTLPVTSESDCFFERGDTFNMYLGGFALDPEGNPWLSVVHQEKRPVSTSLTHFENGKWVSIDLLPFLQAAMPGRNIAQADLSFDRNGTLYIAASGAKGDGWWGSPLQEVILMKSQDKGKSFEVTAISEFDSAKPNWLPSIEKPFSANLLDKAPCILYTCGFPGKGVRSKINTDVIFTLLE